MMATIAQNKRRRLIENAEGYLDLAVVFEDFWSLSPARRKKLAARAIECLNEVKKPLGHKPYVLFLKGQAHRIAERFQRAANFFEQSAKLDPDNLNCLLALAWCYKRTNRLDQAIEALANAVQVDGASAIAHYNLACYQALSVDVEQAVLHLSTAIDLNAKYRDLVADESDFDPIRDTPGFQHLFGVNA